ncbi:MAG TPA: hypothetical protein VHB97_10530 [Polyangia bacterium]|nr:hypothetical protein [Polyangia bacterium]
MALICGGVARAESNDAREVYKHAETAYALGRFNEAAQLFERVFELKQDPVVLFDAAQAHRLAGNKQKALVLYENYLRLFGERDNHAAVEKRVIELKAAIEADRVAAAAAAASAAPVKTPPSEPAVTTPPPDTTHAADAPVAAAPLTLVAEPPPKPAKKKTWVWGVVVGGVVVVGAAVALGVVFGSSSSAPSVSLGTVRGN